MTARVLTSTLVLWFVSTVAIAQAQTIVVGPPSRFAQQIAERLQDGLDTQDDPPQIQLSATSGDCTTPATDESTHAAVTITIGADAVVQICVRTDHGVSTRTLGPLPALDAASVEQIATVVEASLDAIRPPPPATPPATVAEVAPVIEVAPLAIQPLPDPPAPAPHAAPRHAAGSHANDQRIETSRRYSVTFDYQLMVWNGDTLVHGMHVGARRLIVASWLWLSGGLGAALPFQKAQGAIGATFWAIALDAAIGVHLPLGPDVVLGLSFGPRLEWLSVSAVADQAVGAHAEASGLDFSVSSVFALVPRFAVASNVSVALGVGVILAHNGRAYAVDRGDAVVTLMDQSAPRPYLHVGAVLAL